MFMIFCHGDVMNGLHDLNVKIKCHDGSYELIILMISQTNHMYKPCDLLTYYIECCKDVVFALSTLSYVWITVVPKQSPLVPKQSTLVPKPDLL